MKSPSGYEREETIIICPNQIAEERERGRGREGEREEKKEKKRQR